MIKISRIHKIGFVTTLAIALLIWGFHFLKGNNLFSPENYYVAVFERVDGLSESSPVVVNGYKIGQVKSITFLPSQGSIFVVEIGVKDDYQLPSPATAVLFSTDFMGTKAIKLLMGNSQNFHKTGDTIPAYFEPDMFAELKAEILPIKDSALAVISTADSLLLAINSVFSPETTENLRNAISSLNSTLQNVEQLTASLNSVIQKDDEKIQLMIENFANVSASLKNIADSLENANLTALVNNANNAVAQLENTLRTINEGDGTVTMLLNDKKLYSNLDSTAYHLSKLLEDLKANPKRYVHFSLFGGKVEE